MFVSPIKITLKLEALEGVIKNKYILNIFNSFTKNTIIDYQSLTFFIF